MLTTLLESNATSPRRRISSLVSLSLHAAAVAALVVATANANVAPPANAPDMIAYVAPPAVEQPPELAAPGSSASAPTPAALPAPVAPALVAPDIVPLDIPAIDLSRAPVNASDFVRRSSAVPQGAACCAGANALGSGDNVWSERYVEKAAAMRPGTEPPVYPDLLRTQRITGEVRVRFVVDSAGRVDLARLTVVSSDHALFSRAVETALRRARYLPAEVGGRPVAQLVEQTFLFQLDRE